MPDPIAQLGSLARSCRGPLIAGVAWLFTVFVTTGDAAPPQARIRLSAGRVNREVNPGVKPLTQRSVDTDEREDDAEADEAVTAGRRDPDLRSPEYLLTAAAMAGIRDTDPHPEHPLPDGVVHKPEYPRPSGRGRGSISIGDPAEYPRIEAFVVHDPDSFWDSMRPNLLGEEITEEWDFSNLISTDRPDFTDNPFSVGRDVTIIESGYTYHRINTAGSRFTQNQLPEALVRYGVTDEFELRLKWMGLVNTYTHDQATGGTQQTAGGEDLQVGFKYELWQQENWLPMTSVVSHLYIPAGTQGTTANAWRPTANIVAGWGIRRWLYFKVQTGFDVNRSPSYMFLPVGGGLPPAVTTQYDNYLLWHQSATFLVQISKHFGGFAEWYSFFGDQQPDNRAAHYLDTGVYIYITPDVQLDARIGSRVSDRYNDVFTGMGFSVRF